MRLPFSAAPAGYIFQCKIDQIFKELANIFGIAGNILIVGYDTDGKERETTLR